MADLSSRCPVRARLRHCKRDRPVRNNRRICVLLIDPALDDSTPSFLFTCGMVLADTTDGIAMRAAYGWAFLRPIRKIYYNLTVTVISVAVAFAIGGVELLQVLASELNLTGHTGTGLQSLISKPWDLG